MNPISLIKIEDTAELNKAFAIREKVFVEEQNVPLNEEYDQFENTSVHYLAHYQGVPCGAARWRVTENGVKLERFAVLKEFRNKNVGGHILQQVVADVKAAHPEKLVYLHAQLPAISFYKRHGFQQVGTMFSECDIDHYRMILNG
ncbi:MAG: GNAT family N-acetyltransferase [Hymenobacteraceae bacterium]|nr:GNAT family N-acetyltransferase [Hymenobacteraceae bacterium]MDX5397518.1 GNAT family N-acetyltransferase [Hymenobacteraceae bacterium]MDX5443988.1 GNAT family N-acetyltransferase [Hymenobacteraceae bacterium]MDX5513597.1 GNAT family N-acetyltransferase [Hymenobacteraceae bacterium]